MKTSNKKQEILNVIFERALELQSESIRILSIINDPKDIDYEAIKGAALKKAVKEWKENRPVFNKPNFL